MSELGDKDDSRHHLGRRGFVKTSAKGLAGIGATMVAGKEIVKGENGIETDTGFFIPLYDRHDQQINPEDVPNNLDGYFQEAAIGRSWVSSFAPKDIFRVKFSNYGPGNIIIDAEILSKLAREGTEVIFGDVATIDEINEFIKIATVESGVFAGSLLTALATHIPSVRKMIDSKVGIGRRNLLKGSIAGIGLWSASSTRPYFHTKGLLKNGNTTAKAITRIAARIEGIGSDFHPELAAVFYRNLIMSDKILTVAEQMKKEKGKKPRIVFHVEGGHSGIEDFLQAGHDVVRSLMLAYPETWSKQNETDEGINNLCTARLYKFPQDFQPKDIDDDKKMEEVKERFVVDQVLKDALVRH